MTVTGTRDEGRTASGSGAAIEAAAEAPPGTSGHVPALDGLRAVAVGSVLCFHAGLPGFTGGFLGVDLFFVLSGFLITGILIRAIDSASASGGLRAVLGEFWLRRARRLLPAIFAVALVVAAVRFLTTSGETAAQWKTDIYAAVLYVTNWLQVLRSGDYFAQFADPSPLLQTWSLSIEEQFYVVFPFVVAFLVRRRLSRRALVVVFAAAALASAALMALLALRGASDGRLYFGTDTRAQALLLGAALGAYIPRPSSAPRAHAPLRTLCGWAGLVGFGVLVWTMSENSQLLYRGGFLLLAICGAAMVWAAVGAAGSSFVRVLSWRPLVALGLISYGIYLWHWPIFLWVGGTIGDRAPASVTVLKLSLTLAAAVASYFLIERPVRFGKFTALPAPRQAWSFVAAGALVLAVASVPTLPAITGREIAPVVALDAQWPARDQIPEPLFVGGDSVAYSMAIYFPKDRYADFGIEGSSIMGCGLTDDRYFFAGEPADESAKCDPWASQWRDVLEKKDVRASIVPASLWDLFDRDVGGVAYAPGTPQYAEVLDRGVRETVAVASRDGTIPVYVLGFSCLRPPRDKDVLEDPARVRTANAELRRIVQGIPGATFIDMEPITCAGDQALTEVNGVKVRADGVHWSPEGGEYVWQYVLNEIAKAQSPPA